MYDFDTDFEPGYDDTRDDCFEVERDEYYDDADPGEMDGDHETALESVYGPEDDYLDSSWEDRFDGGYDDF